MQMGKDLEAYFRTYGDGDRRFLIGFAAGYATARGIEATPAMFERVLQLDPHNVEDAAGAVVDEIRKNPPPGLQDDAGETEGEQNGTGSNER